MKSNSDKTNTHETTAASNPLLNNNSGDNDNIVDRQAQHQPNISQDDQSIESQEVKEQEAGSQESPQEDMTSIEELQSYGSASAFEGSEFLIAEDMPRHNKRDPNDPSGLEDY